MAPWIATIGKFLSNPEVMKKVCDVLPDLADDFKEIALSYPDLVKEAEKLNQQNMDAYNEMCKIVLNELQKILDSGEASEETGFGYPEQSRNNSDSFDKAIVLPLPHQI